MSYKKYLEEQLSSFGFVPVFNGYHKDGFSGCLLGVEPELVEKEILTIDKKNSLMSMEFEGENYCINPKLIDEMYSWYKYINEIINSKNYDISFVKNQLVGILDKKIRKKRLRKLLEKYQVEFSENPFVQINNKSSTEYLIDDGNFIEFIKDTLSNQYDLIDDYLKNKINEDSLSFHPLKDDLFLPSWDFLVKKKEVLDYINEELSSLNIKKNINDNTPSNKVPTPLKMQILLLDKIRNIPSDKWDDLSNNKKGEILAKLLNRDQHTIRTKALKILEKNSTLSYTDKEIVEKCNTYWNTLDI
ncbi:hypothetical protein [Tenacibaculum finnmarkense]|uniref:hypothetical protein n=1 Tax=Tenacibaculum finnmarkense TaxID=2781243 RepID=UPI001E4596D8|nr:hypothetical protein [Tenacibaculum finnmarkense]MCD8448482.1 hypothetical protein [Tenacibaculum dicentrarchi]MCG8251100.1 hypothetical protein [Tenacibaculum finnmarkense genomovar finnmarkense]MCG8748420.1 hypothetical protein [Tenacibaculum finnmarkense]MCG8814211.1 hypothetical protein [Tenacibaculum finnmarkense]MCG8819236.1 hypothetical protein [Tenacibaculum finnmarkense]